MDFKHLRVGREYQADKTTRDEMHLVAPCGISSAIFVLAMMTNDSVQVKSGIQESLDSAKSHCL